MIVGEHEGNMSRIAPNQGERSVDAERSASLIATMRHSCTFTHVDVFSVSLWTPDQNSGYLANIVQKPGLGEGGLQRLDHALPIIFSACNNLGETTAHNNRRIMSVVNISLLSFWSLSSFKLSAKEPTETNRATGEKRESKTNCSQCHCITKLRESPSLVHF